MNLVTAIPTAARLTVKVRERHRCALCGTPAPRGEWHHRRSRSIQDQHQHCPCNGVFLHQKCHRWVHAHPFQAKGVGFIVSRYQPEPGTVPMVTPWGTRALACDGTYTTIQLTEEGTS